METILTNLILIGGGGNVQFLKIEVFFLFLSSRAGKCLAILHRFDRLKIVNVK